MAKWWSYILLDFSTVGGLHIVIFYFAFPAIVMSHLLLLLMFYNYFSIVLLIISFLKIFVLDIPFSETAITGR